MKNGEISGIFRDIANLLEQKKENWFKIRAYRKVADSIDELTDDVEKLVYEDRLQEISGVGPAIKKKITEMITTGKLAYYEKLKMEFPEEESDQL